MDLKALFSLTNKKKFYYLSGLTNNTDNLYLDFSTGLNGRGDAILLRVGSTDNDITIYKGNETKKYENIQDSEIFNLISSL